MYKDKEAQKIAVRLAVQKHRGITQGITSEGITLQGITNLKQDEQGYWYQDLKGGLSGQRWYPGRNGYHPDNCKCGIVHASNG